MFWIVQDRLVTPRQERRRKRNVVERARAGFGCQIHFESRSGQHLVWMQSLYEEHAGLVTARIDGTIEAGNCDKGLTGKFIRHNVLLSSLFFAMRIGDTEGGRRDNRYLPFGPTTRLPGASTSPPSFRRARSHPLSAAVPADSPQPLRG